MTFPVQDFRKYQRWAVAVTLVLVAGAVWVNALNSGIVKAPLFGLGAMLVAALFFARSILEGKTQFALSTIETVVALHIPLFLLSAMFSFHPTYTWNALLFGVSCVIFFFAGTSLYSTKKEVTSLFFIIEIVTAVLCAVAFIQYFFVEHLPVNFLLHGNKRVSSLMGNSTFLASYLVVVFLLVLSQTLHLQSQRRRAPLRYVLLAAIALTLFTTQARSSTISLVISLFVFLTLSLNEKNSKRTASIVFAVFAAGLIWIFLVNPSIGHRFTTMFEENRESSFARRIYFWTGGKEAFLSSPVFGHGIGSFESTLLRYRSPEYWRVNSEDIVPHAHNELVEIATEYGIIGIIGASLTFILLLRRGIATSRTTKGWEHWTAAGLTSSVVALSVDNFANVTLRQAPVAAFAWLLFGVLCSQTILKEKAHLISFQLPAFPRFLASLPLLGWIPFAFLYGAHSLDVFHSNVRTLKGINFSIKRMPAAALQEFRNAVEDDPMNLAAHSLLSLEFLRAGQWNESIASVAILQHLSPLYPKSSLIKAYALMSLKRYPESLQTIEEELRLRTHPEAHQIQAMVYKRLGKSKQEREALVSLLKKDIEGKIGFEVRYSCLRLLELSSTQPQRKEITALFDALAAEFPNDSVFSELRAAMYPAK